MYRAATGGAIPKYKPIQAQREREREREREKEREREINPTFGQRYIQLAFGFR